jgi:hypothetical protein
MFDHIRTGQDCAFGESIPSSACAFDGDPCHHRRGRGPHRRRVGPFVVAGREEIHVDRAAAAADPKPR